MINSVGYILLLYIVATSCIAIITRDRIQIFAFYTSSISPIFCFLLLVYGFVISDFSLKNVFLNSSSELPFIYKVAASWSSHEGSFLFWFGITSFISFLYIKYLKLGNKTRIFSIIILSLIQILFVSFIIFTSNPFDALSFSPSQGLGLNPVLQDIAISIHPPILYLGNACYITLFTAGLSILYNPGESELILLYCKKFLNLALSLLTIGIGLGAWWAYRELGWGGYWFFDPVENISLLPWLSGIALHHFLIMHSYNKQYLKWIVFLSLLSFLLILYGTFIVRSGIISSVHSFAFSAERGIFIFSISLILTIFSVSYFILRHKLLNSENTNLNHKELSILLGNIFWLIALGSLIVALIYPIYCYLALGMDVTIDPDYFHKVFITICIPIIILASVSPNLDKKRCVRFGFLFLLSSIVFLTINTKAIFSFISGSICFSSIFLILQMLDYILVESKYFQQSISSNKIALFLSHFGFGLLALSITLNCVFLKEIEFIGKIGDEVVDSNFKIKLENIKFSESINYYRQIVIFRIQDHNDNVVVLKPENRLYKIEKSLSQEVDIFSFIFHDLYAVLSQIDKQTIHAKIYYQPFISFIWLSIIIMASGFCVSLFNFRKNILL